MNPTTSSEQTSSSPTMTAGNLFQQFSNPVANLNAAVVAAAQQFLPKSNISTLFTIEQLELIRRLRMTGISADAVLEAFQTLEKIETDLGASNVQSLALAALMGTPPKLFANEALKPAEVPPVISTTSPTLLHHFSTQAFSNTSGMPSLSTPLGTSINGIETPRTPPNLSPEHRTLTTVPFASTAADVSLFFPNLNQQLSTVPPTSSSSPSTSLNNNNAGGRPIRSQRTPMKEITTLDDPSELDEFMAQGEEGCINDMKQFITQFSLRQTTVAMMTGVSQPYISKLLNGNHRELSLRCRKNIYSWYLNCRRHPEKLAVFLQDPSTRLETNGDGELIPQRRERYVFRPILIKILENFFAEMPFPDYSKRVEIAAACNSALQMDKKGAGLMPKEVVSPQVVANWFANKRKEMRRRSNEDPQFGRSFPQPGEEQNLPSPPTSGSNASPVETENGSADFFGSQFESFKNVFNLNNLYLKQKQEPMEVVSQSSGSPPSSAELDKISTNLLQSLLASQSNGFNFSKIEQTAE